jgi:four helix bundle protein
MVKRFRDLRVYRDAFRAARSIFEQSKTWPKIEQYALTDQIRRSSRSVNANIAEAWRKRRYPKHFVSKLTDADAEAAETRAWLDFAFAHGYLSREVYDKLDDRYDKIQASLVKMMNASDRWCGPSGQVREELASYFVQNTANDSDAHTPFHPDAQTPR